MIGNAAKNIWIKLDKIAGIVIAIGVFCLIFVLVHRAIFDLDIWLHLKAGEVILQAKSVPSRDIFSFVVGAKPWVDHSWLFQVISYFTYSVWQAEGLISLETYTLILVFLFLFLIGYKFTKSYIETAIFVFIAVYASMGRFNIRPDIFSLLFFTIYLYLLKFHSDKKIIYLLVPVQILWVNFHGYFFLGILLVFLFILAEFLRRRLKFIPIGWRQESLISQEAYQNLKKLFCFIILASLANPNGLRGMLYPLFVFKETLLGQNRVFFGFIQELQPTFQANRFLGGPYYGVIAILSLVLMAFNFKRLKIIDIFLFLLFFAFSLTIRHTPFFSFVGFIIIVSYLAPIIDKIKAGDYSRQRIYFILKYALAAFFIIWLGLKINNILDYHYYDFEAKEFKSVFYGIDDTHYPKKAVDFVLENNIPPNMFNDFNSGAYLIGRTYPERKVFIDGRTELYGQDFFRAYEKVLQADVPEFEKMVDKYNINAAFFSITINEPPALVSYLYAHPQWKLVFFDDSGIVFLKDLPLNHKVISRYLIDMKKYSAPTLDTKKVGLLKRIYPAPYIKRGYLFLAFEVYDAAILEAQEALRILPGVSKAHYIIGKAYLRKGLYKEALENLRAALLSTPGNLGALIDLGECLKELQDYDLAIKTLKRALKLNKRYAPAYCQLGSVYSLVDNKTEAIKNFNEAVRYAPENAEYRLKLGQLLYIIAKDNKDKPGALKAKAELEEAHKLNYHGRQDLLKEIDRNLQEIKRFLAEN